MKKKMSWNKERKKKKGGRVCKKKPDKFLSIFFVRNFRSRTYILGRAAPTDLQNALCEERAKKRICDVEWSERASEA